MSNWQDTTGFITSAVTHHGFTGHEHLDDLGLIHMNGRVYDPTLGRFLSADPTIKYVASTQGLNRYSYTDNNPLSRIDSSGYNWWSDRWEDFRQSLSSAWDTFRKSLNSAWSSVRENAYKAWQSALSSFKKYKTEIITIAAAVYTGGATLAATGSAVAAGAVSGAVVGGITGYQQGGVSGLIIGAATGGLSGAMFGDIITYYGDYYGPERIFWDGTAGGLTAELNGAKFEDGFKISAGLSAFTSAALYMRDKMIAQSKLDPLGRNKTGQSVGFRDDKFKLGGGRYNPDSPRGVSWLGGKQGGPGSLFDAPYSPGSWQDRLVEAYAGPHDFLNSAFWYDPLTGNIRTGLSSGIPKVVGELLNATNVVIATPIVSASVIQPYTNVALIERYN